MPLDKPRARPIAFARQEDVDALSEAVIAMQDRVAGLEARSSVVERAVEAMLEDFDSLMEALQGGESEEDALDAESVIRTAAEAALAATRPVDEEEPEETPEEEAARLRREAIAEFEASNEAAVPAAGDFNDVTDVPEEGRPIA